MLNRVVWKLLRRTLAVAAGGSLIFTSACIGEPLRTTHTEQANRTAQAKYIPVQVLSSSITPKGTIHLGDKVRATTRLDPPVSGSLPFLVCRDLNSDQIVWRRYPLYDDGTHGDQTAHDGMWTLELAWSDDIGTGPSFMLSLSLINSEIGVITNYGMGVSVHVEPDAKDHRLK